jgi:hypothetical protein
MEKPISLAKLGACLEGLTPPDGPFDPLGAWEHRYALWTVLPVNEGMKGKNAVTGAFALRRAPGPDGTATLEVRQAARVNQGQCRVTAHITVAADRLATPRSWEVESVLLDPQRRPVADTRVRTTGRVAEGALVWRDRRERTRPAPAALTSNWSLFDALQRLPADLAEPLRFDMVEELELFKPRQTLARRESVPVELGGRTVTLHRYVQVGDGILPYDYWLDDRRRVLLAVGGMRAYVFDPNAVLPEVKP